MLAGVAALFLYRIAPGIADPDVWHEMALAREALASGWVPLEDRFGFTPTVYPSVHQEWGAGLVAIILLLRSIPHQPWNLQIPGYLSGAVAENRLSGRSRSLSQGN